MTRVRQRLSPRLVLGDAALLWRTDRDLMLRIAAPLVMLPMLAVGWLASGIDLAADATPDQVRAAVTGFYQANILTLFAISLVLEFGTMMLLHLYLQRGASVGEGLRACAVRLLPWMLLALANGALLQLGMALFVLPGIYIYGRTWLMGPAYLAEPERGLLGAVESGFRLSQGNGWRLALLALGVAVVLAAGVLALVIVAQLIGTALGGGALVEALLLIPVAAAGGLAYAFHTLVRIAAYRRLGGSINGM